MNREKTVLFVTYGGGHARMVIPVLWALAGIAGIRTVTLALTSAGPLFDSAGLPYFGYKDLLTAEDTVASDWGNLLATKHHRPEIGIAKEESIAYLGLSYWDMIQRHGDAEAARLFQEHGRQAFYPLSIMERVMDKFTPDMVVTTNSPRSEQAAVTVAKGRGIPTLSMFDILGTYSVIPLEADYITVLSEPVISNIQAYQGVKPNQTFLVTGNPAFDSIFDERGPIDYSWRRQYLPGMPEQAKALLWIDAAGHHSADPTDAHGYKTHLHSDKEIGTNLDQLARAARYSGACLLIRPHPSQPAAVFHEWIRKAGYDHVFFAGDLPMHPLLRAVNAVAIYYSTVGCEAVLMQRPVLQLNYYDANALLPLGEWGLARLVEQPQDLPDALRETLNDTRMTEHLLSRATELFPQERAAPKIAGHIKQILFHGRAAVA